MRVLFHNTIMNYFSVDARFFRSFIPLLIRPGYLAKKYVSGKRLLYLHPAQFYLFSSIVFFFIFSIFTRDAQQAIDAGLRTSIGRKKAAQVKKERLHDSIKDILIVDLLEAGGKDTLLIQKLTDHIENKNEQPKDSIQNDSIKVSNKEERDEDIEDIQGTFLGFDINTEKLDSLNEAGASMDVKLEALLGEKASKRWFPRFFGKQIIRFQEKKGDGISKAFLEAIPISMFFLIPIFALLLKLFYRKRGRFAHHMVFSFYYFAFIFLASSIIIVTNYIVNIPDWIDTTLVVSMLIYLWISLKHFYEQGYILTFFKTTLLTAIYLIFVVPLTFLILSVVSFLTY